MYVSIPQAVGTFTLFFSFSPSFGQGLEMCGPHRHFSPLRSRTLRHIPQVVSTVATDSRSREIVPRCSVSIPQAVGAVATMNNFSMVKGYVSRFQYRKR